MNNNSNNLPSVLECSSNSRSFDILDDIIIIGNDNGFIDVFQWEEEHKISSYNLFKDDTTKDDNNNYKQIIQIKVFDKENKVILIQCRGGDIFICKWMKNQNKFEIMNTIKTHIETFTKGALCFDKSILICNKKSDNKDEWLFSFILPEEKENHLRIFEISKDNYKLLSDYSVKVYLEDNNEDNDDSDDSDESPMKKSIINNILITENNNIILSFESGIVGLYNMSLRYLHHLELFENKNEPIITLYSYTIKSNTYICVGMFSTNLVLLTIKSNKLLKHITIEKACSDIKCGVSAIAYSSFTKESEFEDTSKDIQLLLIGGYDKRVKCFQIEKEDEYTDIGNIITGGSGIINQIAICEKEGKEYLFVCCEQKLFYIYLLF